MSSSLLHCTTPKCTRKSALSLFISYNGGPSQLLASLCTRCWGEPIVGSVPDTSRSATLLPPAKKGMMPRESWFLYDMRTGREIQPATYEQREAFARDGSVPYSSFVGAKPVPAVIRRKTW